MAPADDPLGRLTAGYSPARSAAVAVLTVAGLALVAWRHADGLRDHDRLAWIWIGLSVLMAAVQVLAWADRPKKVGSLAQAGLDALRVTVNIPVYNEDPEALRLVALALATQTRPAQRAEFVDDGSDKFDYRDVAAEITAMSSRYPATDFRWVRTERGPDSGKRSAQAVTFRGDPYADVFATLDSDTVLDPRAIEEGLKPLADPRVQSVAAVLLVFNAGTNLITALTEIWLAVYQLGVRSAWSGLGRVMVNSGGLAFYRGDLVREALPAYLGEKFAGKKVGYSDDAMLTFFAMLRGKTVQQPTCFAFTIMPENVSHHVRQQLRWFRGNVIRTFWWFRYLSPARLAWWLGFLSWAEFAVTTILLGVIAGSDIAAVVRHLVPFPMLPFPGAGFPAAAAPLSTGAAYAVPAVIALAKALIPSVPLLAGLSYLVSLRAVLIRRGDQSLSSRLLAFACSPLITVWSMTVLRGVRLWAIVTSARSDWGTRDKVEVSI